MLEDITIKPVQYLEIKPSEAWNTIRRLAEARYHYSLPGSYDFDQLPFNKLAALRDLCLNVGLVI